MGQSDTPGGVNLSRRVNLHLPDDFVEHIESQKPRALALSAFCALLIERGLDKSETGQTMGEPAPRRGSSSTSSLEDSSLTVSLSPRQEKQPKSAAFAATPLPAELESARDTFVQFGKVKKGDRGEHGAKLAATGLRKIGEKYGWDVAREQLDLAVNNRWNGISLSNYEKFLPKATAAAQAEYNHPAYRVFTAENGFGDEPVTNPVLKELI